MCYLSPRGSGTLSWLLEPAEAEPSLGHWPPIRFASLRSALACLVPELSETGLDSEFFGNDGLLGPGRPWWLRVS